MDSLAASIEGGLPALLSVNHGPVWPSGIDISAWTPAGLAALVPKLGPVRVGTVDLEGDGIHEFWNADEGVAAADEQHGSGFRPMKKRNETLVSEMAMERFWQPAKGAVHYYSGSLLDNDGRASLPELQRGLEELITLVNPERSDGSKPAHFLKVWLGTAGATTPLHYDTQHNVYAQLHGDKVFWLSSPISAGRSVDLYPRIHSLSHFGRGGDVRQSAFIAASLNADESIYNLPAAYARQSHDCFEHSRGSGKCMLRVRLVAGDVLYLPPFWMHRATCRSDACASVNVWVSSQPMHRMEALEAMPLPFEGSWSMKTRLAAVLAFLRALLLHVHATEEGVRHAMVRDWSSAPPGVHTVRDFTLREPLTPAETVHRLLSTRWRDAETELLRERPDGPSHANEMAAAAECAPRGGADGTNSTKIGLYARARADALADGAPFSRTPPWKSWRGPKLTLLHDQIERIAHWATAGDAAATHSLLRRLQECCALERQEHDEL